jgi:hypothetical protein
VLSSKDILERTGLSRATLNNYIAAGLVPRPDVLPPGPNDGGSPRLGYFPDDTIERLETIQRLKREGWSLGRIVEHFAGGVAEAEPVPSHGAEPHLPPRPVPASPVGTERSVHVNEPEVAVVAALAVELDDADGLRITLSVHDYFALSVEFESEVREIVGARRGQATRLAPYRFLCHFMAAPPSDALAAALDVAKRLRSALARLGARWKLRRDIDIQVNSGLAAGEAWVGGAANGEVQVVGDVGGDALHLARAARKGALLLSREFVARLPAAVRSALVYGAPSSDQPDGPYRLMTFSRLRSLGGRVDGLPRRVADMAAAEFIESRAGTDDAANLTEEAK